MDRFSKGIILFCVAVVMGIVISLGMWNIALVLLVVCLLAAVPSKWIDKLWKD